MHILIVDDEARLANVLQQALVAEGFEDVHTATNGEEALGFLRTHSCDLLVTDLRMPRMSGLELLAEVKRRSPGTEVVLMTAFAEVDTAREALKRGALDYLVKPFDNEELVSLVDQVQSRRVVRTAATGAAESSEEVSFAGLVGGSQVMLDLYKRVERAASSEVAVLILGESGVGKELVARAIHNLSPRHRNTFVEVDCASIPSQLLESELFGHERGAFTGAVDRKTGRLEAAAGGTVFLDEIGEMPLELQPKLLRFLQERQFYRVGGTERIAVDARVIAATNRVLQKEVETGRFREDLFFRLDVFSLRVPALRERVDDIPALVRHFLQQKGGSPHAITGEAMAVLQNYPWPGNVRELENAIARAVIEAGDGPINAEHLPEKIAEADLAAAVSGSGDTLETLDLAQNERWLIEQALKKEGGNKTRAAAALGISRRRLYSRMKLLGMDLDIGEAVDDDTNA